ncbi:hypothetical protein VU04_10010, partial [Desulfobulbus sp. TB]|nr:hypothetical protein [Desulfobulbus sp. TB]
HLLLTKSTIIILFGLIYCTSPFVNYALAQQATYSMVSSPNFKGVSVNTKSPKRKFNHLRHWRRPKNMFYSVFWREYYSALDFGAVGDGETDDTAAIQSAIDFISANKLGKLYVPAGIYVGNWTIKSDVIIVGAGQHATIFRPYINDAVFKTATDTHTVRIGWRDSSIQGDKTMSTQDGIVLKSTTTSTWIDTVTISNVRIDGSGRYGLWVYGENVRGPFVQRLHVTSSTFVNNAEAGLRMEGASFESIFDGVFIDKNGGSEGDSNNAEIISRPDDENPNRVSRAHRVLFTGSNFNHNEALKNGYKGTAMYIEHADQVTFLNCNFENADPMLHTKGALTRSILVQNSNFGSIYDADNYIKLDDAHNVIIENSTFGATGAVTNYIAAKNNIKKVTNLQVERNTYGSTITGHAANINIHQPISDNTIEAYKNFMLIDSEGSIGSDELEFIYDGSGKKSNNGLISGKVITLALQHSDRHITVKSGTGNILLSDNEDFVLSHISSTLTLVWNSPRNSWIEISRSY